MLKVTPDRLWCLCGAFEGSSRARGGKWAEEGGARVCQETSDAAPRLGGI